MDADEFEAFRREYIIKQYLNNMSQYMIDNLNAYLRCAPFFINSNKIFTDPKANQELRIATRDADVDGEYLYFAKLKFFDLSTGEVKGLILDGKGCLKAKSFFGMQGFSSPFEYDFKNDFFVSPLREDFNYSEEREFAETINRNADKYAKEHTTPNNDKDNLTID